MFLVRFLEETDADEYLRLRWEALQSHPVAFGSSWEEEQTHTPESVRPRLRTVPEGNFMVGAFRERKLIGMAGFVRATQRKARHKGFLWGVYVTPAERGKGAAGAILLALLERVRGYDDLEQVTLSVAVSQENARRLYTSLGFETYGYEKNALKVGDRYVDEEHQVLWLKPH